ncbi:hypothetical protein E7811_12090 [Aliigemmobacter aestuarii]|uniref:Uncharacterized protein n=1 Tax=Aliigemmobacter aestuarii TaxID=1445661 RepID=A0A4S3ML09_9RHOB|nr:hypothetical protein [Gemmobacter aestuarii]THD82888.1 hypothetical protein E7811_12090 [Gemmobacter aestuarii]
MQILVILGAVIALAGVGGLVWCILQALKARHAGLDDAAMRAALQRVVVMNMAALGVSALGLMMVVAGIMLS